MPAWAVARERARRGSVEINGVSGYGELLADVAPLDHVGSLYRFLIRLQILLNLLQQTRLRVFDLGGTLKQDATFRV